MISGKTRMIREWCGLVLLYRSRSEVHVRKGYNYGSNAEADDSILTCLNFL
jgi:hypothetical protein